MPIQDQGPRYNLGFGMPMQDTERGPGGHSNAVEKALNGHPIMRFFAVAGASAAAMGLAGKVVREGGLRFLNEAQKAAKGTGELSGAFNEGIGAFRRIEAHLDALQGIERTYVDAADKSILVGRDMSGRLTRDKTDIIDSAFMRGPDQPAWSARDAIQQRLIAQARRLPYEAPGFYIAQKAVLDPLFGENKDPKNKVNWGNPFDVIGDFSYNTMKNLATNVLPFDIGGGVVKQSYERYAMKAATQPNGNLGFVASQTFLKQLGVSASDLADKAIKQSNQSLGAFSSMISEASGSNKGFTDWVRSRKNAAFTNDIEYRNAGYARKLYMQAVDVTNNRDARRDVLDMMPGPFKGVGSGAKKFKQSHKEIGQTYDNWQNLMQGKLDMNSLRKKDPLQYENLRSFMQKGGGTSIERLGKSSFDLGKGGPLHPDGTTNLNFKSGQFHTYRAQDNYNALLVDQLQKNALLVDQLQKTAGLSAPDAAKFVRTSHKVSSYPGTNAADPGGDNLMERFRFVSNRFHGNLKQDKDQNSLDWFANLTRSAGKHGIQMKGDKPALDLFREAVGNTDAAFASAGFQQTMTQNIGAEWNALYAGAIPQQAAKSIRGTKKPFELFAGTNLERNKDFLVRRTAEKMGINTIDNSGNALPMDTIKRGVWNRGLNPDNAHRLRGYLIDQKEIAKPWHLKGANAFGFKAMTMEQALKNNYFGANDQGVQTEINRFINHKTYGNTVGRGANMNQAAHANPWDLKMDKVYIGPNGKVLDVGRIGRGIMGAADKFANDYQIPLLHMNPLKQLGWGSFQAMRNKGSIIYSSGDAVQPIALAAKAAGKEVDNPNFYLYMKTSANSARGNVVGLSGDRHRGLNVHQYDGTYKPYTTNSKNMLGRYSNIALGKEDTPGSAMQEARWKRLFGVSHDQENNMFLGKDSAAARWYKALKRKPEAYRNPYRAAEEFAKPGFDTSKMTEHMSEGVERLTTSLRASNLSKRSLENIARGDPRFSQINDLLNTPDNLVPGAIRDIMAADRKLVSGSTVERAKLGRVQQNMNNLLAQGEKQVNFWDLPVADNIKTSGISRRIDQAKGEAFDYLIARTDIVNRATGGSLGHMSFNDNIQALILKLENQFSKGIISGTEKAEGRAAILSLQLENSRNATYQSGSENFLINHSKATLDHLFNQGVETKSLMREVGEFNTFHEGGKKGFFKKKASQLFAQVPYEKPFQNNPTGTDTLFMPTFKTAFNNAPRKAVKSMLGVDWTDPQGMSGASIPMMHMSLRLNKYLETFGVGLDPTLYKGAFDFFAKGVIGKRVLPIYAVGATALAVDRQAGGVVNKDANGDPVYSPLVLGTVATGVVGAQAALAGVIPGGLTAKEKMNELQTGEVPVRQGRFWLLGSTPFKGGRIQYFRPSWYQRLKSGANFTPEMNDTPLEHLAFGEDFSPLKALDPYHYERQNYESRPYPITGDYFTGPWGPLNSALNATVGKILKPQKRMHKEETAYALSQYNRVGNAGAYFSPTPLSVSGAAASDALSTTNANYSGSGAGTSSAAPFYASSGYSAPRGGASAEVRGRATAIAGMYQQAAQGGQAVGVYDGLVPYGVPRGTGIAPRVVQATSPVDYNSTTMAARRFGYQNQELLGIYGFGSSTIRENLGFGNKDLTPSTSVLEPSSRGYSSSRSFWGLNLGGIGDLPLPVEGRFANLELSEIVRRFVPKDPAGIDYVNNIPNLIGKQNPWLPGADYPIANVKSGDPYNSIPDANIRLPGTGYNRTHQTFQDMPGQSVGSANMHDILGDIAPWSQEYRMIDAQVDGMNLSPMAQAKVAQTRAQVDAMRYKNEFTPYKYRYEGLSESVENPTSSALGRGYEWLTHRDTYLNNKLGAPRTAVEDWERNSVYGSTFPEWKTPYQSFIKPTINKSTQRDPISAALAGGGLGFLFGVTAEAKTVGSVIGGAVGLSASLYGHGYKALTGDRFVPLERRKELALEENIDMLDYTRSMHLAAQARTQGDQQTAEYFMQQSKQTMFGADLDGTPEQLAMAVPKRKREHFRAMLYAPQQEREQILSTAPRLERRLFQAAWGMPVEQRPDIKEYFEKHELPGPEADIWNPSTSMDNITIKMGQSMGLNMAQMGYFPQQLQEANLINPNYPSFNQQSSSFSVKAQIRRLMFGQGLDASVSATPSPYSNDRTQITAGVYN